MKQTKNKKKQKTICIIIDDYTNNELISLLNLATKLKKEINCHIEVVVFNSYNKKLHKTLCNFSIKKIWIITPCIYKYQFDIYKEVLCDILTNIKPCLVWGLSSLIIKAVFPRVAIKLNSGLCADCIGYNFNENNKKVSMLRIAMFGNICAKIESNNSKMTLATLRTSNNSRQIQNKKTYNPNIFYYRRKKQESEYKYIINNYTNKKNINKNITIGLGDGVQTDDLENIKKIASTINASIVCTRKASVKFHDYKRVGMTGAKITTNIYIALGISGAYQHMEGITANTIISINTDPHAQIILESDYYMLANVSTFIKKWLEYINSKNTYDEER